jgi:hypothetical protein
MSTNKSVSEATASCQKKNVKKKLNSIILSKLSKPTNLLQISYFTDKLAFNKGGGELIPSSRGSIAVEHLNATPGSGGNTGENELGISFLLRNRLGPRGHITPPQILGSLLFRGGVPNYTPPTVY